MVSSKSRQAPPDPVAGETQNSAASATQNSAANGSPAGGLFPDRNHDHSTCVRAALARAEHLCTAGGGRLTPLRRRVFEVVWQSHTPIGAYDILALLGEGGGDDGKKAQPPTVYRALDFLLAHGLVHRIERLNAYIGCTVPGTDHSGQFLICSTCGVAGELVDAGIDAAMGDGARAVGFTIEQPTVELHGVCGPCRTAKRPGP